MRRLDQGRGAEGRHGEEKRDTLISCCVCVNLDGQRGMRMGRLGANMFQSVPGGQLFISCGSSLSLAGVSSGGLRENEGESEEGEINRETALDDRSIASELRWLSAVVMR